MAGDAPHYTVIGAGIVGMCCALYLQRDGNRVTVIDRLAPGEGTSSGNAGMIQVDACVPIATPGILRDANDPASLISSLSRAAAGDLIADGTISTGMLPKVAACRRALAKGVSRTYIIDGRIRHALLLEIFTRTGIGTEIVP